jgi:hypothetical protein
MPDNISACCAVGKSTTDLVVGRTQPVANCELRLVAASMNWPASFATQIPAEYTGRAKRYDDERGKHMADWYYRESERETDKGPIQLDALLSLINSGQLTPDSLVRPSGKIEWMRAESLAERVRQLQAKKLQAAEPSAVTEPVVIATKQQNVLDSFGINEPATPVVEDYAPAPPLFQSRRIETKRDYPAMRIISLLYRVSALLAVGLSLVVVALAIANQSLNWQVGIGAMYFLVVAVFALAIAEGIRIVLDIESNTRRSADAMESMKAAVEHLAAERG